MKSDITKQPYAEWLEKALSELVDLNPKAIGIVAIMPDGSTGTNYYNVDTRDLTIMVEAIEIDKLDELMRANADYLKEIIEGEVDDD